jgi:hypothetical protein
MAGIGGKRNVRILLRSGLYLPFGHVLRVVKMKTLAALLLPLMAVIACPAMAAVPDAHQITGLMQRALKEGEREAGAALVDTRLSSSERRDALGQFAMMLLTSGQCDATIQFVTNRSEIMAIGIERLVLRAQSNEDKKCVPRLAALMVARWRDPDASTAGQLAMRFLAAAYLDANGDVSARAIRDQTEAELLSQPDAENRWSARGKAINAYYGTPSYVSYLEHLANRLAIEHRSIFADGQGLLEIFAGAGRCDLVAKAVHGGPKSCEEPLRRYNAVREGRVDTTMMQEIAASVRPAITEDSLAEASRAKTPWLRLTKLLLLVSECKVALATK